MRHTPSQFKRVFRMIVIGVIALGGMAAGTVARADEDACAANCLYLPRIAVAPPLSIIRFDWAWNGYPGSITHAYEGLIESTSAVTLTDVVILLEEVDSNGTVVISDTYAPTLAAIPPYGQVAFISRSYPNGPLTGRASIVSWKVAATAPYREVLVLTRETSYTGFNATISGTLQNTSGHTLEDVRLALQIYGPGQAVLAVAIGELAPGQTAPYTVGVGSPYGVSPITDAILQAQGRIKE